MNYAARNEYEDARKEAGNWSVFSDCLIKYSQTKFTTAEKWALAVRDFNVLVASGSVESPVDAVVSAAGGSRMTAASFIELAAGTTDGGISKTVSWVAANLGVKYENISPEGIPGQIAANLLEWAKSDKRTFWTVYYVKYLPSSQQVDAGQRFRDDGRELIELEDELLRMHAEVTGKADGAEKESQG